MEEIRKYCYTGHLTVTREMVIDYLEETEGAIIDPYYEPTDEEWRRLQNTCSRLEPCPWKMGSLRRNKQDD